MEKKIIKPGAVVLTNDQKVEPQGPTVYEVRVPYVHTTQWGGMRVTKVLEWQTTKPTLSTLEAIQKVAQNLGYLDENLRPTQQSNNLKPGRSDLLELLDVQVYPAPGRVLDSGDSRFQNILFQAVPVGGN